MKPTMGMMAKFIRGTWRRSRPFICAADVGKKNDRNEGGLKNRQNFQKNDVGKEKRHQRRSDLGGHRT